MTDARKEKRRNTWSWKARPGTARAITFFGSLDGAASYIRVTLPNKLSNAQAVTEARRQLPETFMEIDRLRGGEKGFERAAKINQIRGSIIEQLSPSVRILRVGNAG